MSAPQEEHDYQQGQPGAGPAQPGSNGSHDSELFDRQLELALSSEEVTPWLRIGIMKDYIPQRVQDAAPELWRQVGPEEQQVLKAQTELKAAQSRLEEASHTRWYDSFLNGIFPARRKVREDFIRSFEEDVRAAQTAFTVASDHLAEALLDRSILPFIRTSISESIGTSYSTEFGVRYSPGISEVFDPRYEISTRSANDLRAIISMIRGGSIGLAGPRGSGKTTLIESVCNGRLKALKDPVLSVQVSAPVEYEPRDFVLHLFARLCEALTGPTIYRNW